MTATEWKERGKAAAETVELTLPSGMVVQARRPGPLALAGWERLPFGLVADAIAGTMVTPGAMNETQVGMAAEFMREVLVYCVVSPRISMEARGEDEIHPRDIPEQDWLYVVMWALRVGEVDALRTFRAGRTDGSGVPDGEDVGHAAERAAGDRGPGDGAGVRPGGDGVDACADGSGGGNAGGNGPVLVRTF